MWTTMWTMRITCCNASSDKELRKPFFPELRLGYPRKTTRISAVFNKITEQVNAAREAMQKYKEEIKEAEEQSEKLEEVQSTGIIQEDNGSYYAAFYNEPQYNKWREKHLASFNEYASENSLPLWDEAFQANFYDNKYNEGTGMYQIPLPFSSIEYFISEENKQAMKQSIDDAVGEAVEENKKELNIQIQKASNEMVLEERKIQAANAEQTDTIKKALGKNSIFNQLNKTVIDAVLGNIGQFDVDYVVKNYGEEDGLNEFVTHIVDFVGSITDEAQSAIEETLNKDYSKLTIVDYINTIYDDILAAVDNNREVADELMELTGIQENINGYFEKLDSLYNYLSPLGMSNEEISMFSLDNIDSALAVFQDSGDEIIDSIEEFYKKLKNTTIKYENDGKLSDIFNSEDYKTQAENIKNSLAAAADATAADQNRGASVF